MSTYLWLEEDKYYKYKIQKGHILWNVDKTIRDIKEKIERENKAFHPEESLTAKTYLVAEGWNRRIIEQQRGDRFINDELPSFKRYKYTEEKKLKLIDKDYFPPKDWNANGIQTFQ
tara:strand:- start:2395 stop:2742 length:348 start_codon:yes stop_codon:yes gene_type:complete